MRFISIFTHEPVNRAPTEAEMAAMSKLIDEAMKEGWLLSTEYTFPAYDTCLAILFLRRATRPLKAVASVDRTPSK